jgi:hypothetical protein
MVGHAILSMLVHEHKDVEEIAAARQQLTRATDARICRRQSMAKTSRTEDKEDARSNTYL